MSLRHGLLVVLALVACEKAKKPAGSLGPYAGVVPKHGVLVEECGLAAKGPECVVSILDADAHTVRSHPFQPIGQNALTEKPIAPARSAELFALARKVLATRTPAASDVSDFTLNLAISDDPEVMYIQVSGPFTDPAAKPLVDALIDLAK